MTKIKATIIADSIGPAQDRLTTMLLTFPRFILAELNTHRMLSKNSASSRAIPFKTMLKSVKENPFIPIAWQKDHKGMQGTEYFNKDESKVNERVWLEARDSALENAMQLNDFEITKQLCNRLLEPFMWHTVLCTATEFSNFFELRCPSYQIDNSPIFKSKKDLINYFENDLDILEILNSYSDLDWLTLNKGQAEIHIMELAEQMWDEYQNSVPLQLKEDEWHIPFQEQIDLKDLIEIQKLLENSLDRTLAAIKISTAMCARTSYTVVGNETKINNYRKDIDLYDILLKSGHMSPFEHCAKSMTNAEYYSFVKGNGYNNLHGLEFESSSHGWCRNFRGFIQIRELTENKI